MANEAIKTAAKEAGVKLWEVAFAFGITDGAFSRKLRFEFSEEDKTKALSAIKSISEQRGAKK